MLDHLEKDFTVLSEKLMISTIKIKLMKKGPKYYLQEKINLYKKDTVIIIIIIIMSPCARHCYKHYTAIVS